MLLELISAWAQTWKGIVTSLVILIVLLYLIFYKVNSYLGEKESELIPIYDIIIDTKSADDNCVRVTGDPCPRSGK